MQAHRIRVQNLRRDVSYSTVLRNLHHDVLVVITINACSSYSFRFTRLHTRSWTLARFQFLSVYGSIQKSPLPRSCRVPVLSTSFAIAILLIKMKLRQSLFVT